MTNPVAGPDRQGPRSGRAGFSLVELIVAMMVLSIGILGLAGTPAAFALQVTLGDVKTERAAAMQSVVEGIRAADYAPVGSGSETVGRYGVTWSVTDGTGRSKSVRVITDGPGLSRDSGTSVRRMGPDVQDTLLRAGTSMNATRRNGFTVVELLIVSVLGALVIGVTYQVLVLNQRT